MAESIREQKIGSTLSNAFLSQWLVWWLWVNSVGRLPGGLGWVPTLLFDILSVGFWVFHFSVQKRVKAKNVAKTAVDWVKKRDWIVLGPVGIALLTAVFYAGILEPIDWDGLDYHLPAILQAVQFKQWGRLEDPYYAVQGFPKLVESLYLFWILHFKSHEYLLLGLIPLFLGAAGFWELSRHFRVSTRWVMILWFTTPIVIKQASSLYIDHFVAAFGILACAALVRREQRSFALALAFFVGSKLSAGVPAVVLVASWVIRYREIPFWVGFYGSATLGVTLLSNFFVFGNPLYPFTFAPFGLRIFPGLFKPSEFVAGVPWASDPIYLRWIRAFFELEFPARWDMLRGAIGVLQGAVVWVGLGTVLAGGLRGKLSLRKAVGILFIPELFLAFLLSSGHWVLRYNLWVLAVFYLWAAALLGALPIKAQRWLGILFVIQAVTLTGDLSWMLGNREKVLAAYRTENYAEIIDIIGKRWTELWHWGEPQDASNPVDLERIRVRKTHGKVYTLCPNPRPQQLAAYYGRDFTNLVYFDPAACLEPRSLGE
ncbi:MAG: hypothetical protein HYX41_00145 [Bdellovibrio sp.]|nr:hypothetical protein [Bdellovibrio sp.]